MGENKMAKLGYIKKKKRGKKESGKNRSRDTQVGRSLSGKDAAWERAGKRKRAGRIRREEREEKAQKLVERRGRPNNWGQTFRQGKVIRDIVLGKKKEES